MDRNIYGKMEEWGAERKKNKIRRRYLKLSMYTLKGRASPRCIDMVKLELFINARAYLLDQFKISF